MFQSDNPALIVIDVQQAIDHFDSGNRNNPNAEQAIARLLNHWRDLQLPVAHVRHGSKFTDSPYHPDSPYFSFKQEVSPLGREKVITKSENCAFIGTQLDEWLKSHGVTELVVCGVLTNNSVDATVRVAAGTGYRVFLPSDATAAFPLQRLDGKFVSAEDVHWIFLSNLDGEYCRVTSVDILLKELERAE
ncbi:cysteine hydrolase family protein [uncultured Microbulbifer sp.]|uniref:cysteine hydrolase family protein n=1 Tax=uncultured Microbulbifer sp. TaxID=348147 RepID=UPI0025F6F421|nr:cysteine hydrolase family protein [uncultured Microbulbifer sp.]